jgi:hypothetical protein
MALDELQDQKSFGAHWSRLEEPYGDVTCKLEKTPRTFSGTKFPVKLQVIKKTLQIPEKC